MWKAYLEPRPELAGHRLWLFREGGWVQSPDRSMVTNMTMETYGRGQTISSAEPFIPYEEAKDFLQSLMDCGWEAGLRPTGFSDHTNELTAVRYHLEDMRKLAKVEK